MKNLKSTTVCRFLFCDKRCGVLKGSVYPSEQSEGVRFFVNSALKIHSYIVKRQVFFGGFAPGKFGWKFGV